jgi:hypothetical protein
MIRLPAALEFRSLARLAAYAVLAALVTAALFAADGAYRWFQDPPVQVAAPTTGERSGDAAATAEAQPAKPSPVLATSPQPETARAEDRATEGSVSAGVQEPASGSISRPAGAAVADGAVSAIPNIAVAPKPDAVSPVSKAPSAPADIARGSAQPPLPPRRPELRTAPAKQATTRERAAPRRPVQAATTPPQHAEKPTEKPNVYWERDGDSQLGFAPSLRRRTCDPATGHMPMQCYYPRESRDQFPAKPLD